MKFRSIFFSLSSVSLSVVMLSLSACAEKRDSTSGTSEVNATTNSIAADSLQEAVDAVADDSATSTSILSDDTYAPKSVVATHACTASGSPGGGVTVAVTYAGTQTQTLIRTRLSYSNTTVESGTLTRIWAAPAGQTLSCNGAATHVRLDWTSDAAVSGMVTTQQVNRVRSATRVVTKILSGSVSTKTNNFAAVGTRSVYWATGSGVSGSNVTRTKTITSAVARTATVTSLSDVNIDLVTTVTTSSTDPMVVDVVRSITNPWPLVSKTIKSGTLIATRVGTDRTESTMSNVVFDMTSDTPCLPTSGSVAVKYFALDTDTEANSTYTIKFGSTTDSGVSITPEGGSETDFPEYNAKGCDLEKEI